MSMLGNIRPQGSAMLGRLQKQQYFLSNNNNVSGPMGFSPLGLFANGEQGGFYDSSDITTLFQDSAGTTPVTTLGQPIGMWKDKSGNNNHWTQPTASSRPTWQQDSNGFYRVSFDGLDDWMQTVAGMNLGNSNKFFTSAAVCKTRSSSGSFVFESASTFSSLGGSGLDLNGYIANGDWFGCGITGITPGDAVLSVDGPNNSVLSNEICQVGFYADLSAGVTSATIISPRKNGSIVTPKQSTAGGANVGNCGNQIMFLGGRGGTLLLQGYIYNLIIRNGVTSLNNQNLADAYIKSKAGVA